VEIITVIVSVSYEKLLITPLQKDWGAKENGK
jgi:hypothetical protein